MSISASGNLSRVSTSLRTFTLISQLQQNAVRIFREEQRIGSGNQLLSVGEDPVAAEKITRMIKTLEGQDQILTNLRTADSNLAAADTAVSEISDLLIEAARIASEQAGSLQSADERTSQAVILDGIIDQLINISNRQFQGQYLFGGRQVTQQPVNSDLGRATFVGDQFDRSTLVDTGFTLPYNIATSELFRLRDEVVGGYANFDVQLSTAGRISELDGATNTDVSVGSLSVTETGIGVTFTVDFTGAGTISDLIAKFNDAAATAGSTLVLGISAVDGGALSVVSGGSNGIQISDIGSGTTAADLGIRKSVLAGADLEGDSVNRRVMLTTLLSDLNPAGLALPSGVSIKNGSLNATVTFGGATTVQDVLNELNGTGIGIRASINSDGDGIEIEDLVAATPLIVGENGGIDAEALGIKSLDPTVALSRLNSGLGLHPVAGDDIRITNANAVAFNVDLSNLNSVQDVLDAINTASAAAGAGITATISSSGAGLSLAGPAGPGNITVTKVSLSPIADELGIFKTGTPTQLVGDDVGAFTQTGVFSALYRLRDGLLNDSSTEITEAGSQIDALQSDIANVAGQLGARSRGMQDRVVQTEQAVSATTALLSGLKDVDFIEAVTKFQEAQTALQSSLLAGSKSMNLSLMDFLR